MTQHLQHSASLKLTHEEFRRADRDDVHYLDSVENQRAEHLINSTFEDAFQRPTPPSLETSRELAGIAFQDAYGRLHRDEKEDPTVIHAATQGGLGAERPSKGVLFGLRVLEVVLVGAEVGVAVLQVALTDASVIVVAQALLLCGGGVLAGRGLAGKLYGAWEPGPLVAPLRDRIRWESSPAGDRMKLLVGLGLIFTVAALRAFAGGLEALILILVTVGLALAIMVTEAHIIELRFLRDRLHDLLFLASEIVADKRHRQSRALALDDLAVARAGQVAAPQSSWFAAYKRALAMHSSRIATTNKLAAQDARAAAPPAQIN